MDKKLSFRPLRKPNIIWVFGDQHRAQALSHRGDPNVFTPNIDNLSRTGINFDCAVSGAPWCTPFRGALLTGKYPHQNGVIRTPSLLDPDKPTVAHSFNDAGYHTAYVGKWHLDGSNRREHYVPPHHRGGFKFWMGYENNNNQHETYVYGSMNETPQRLPKYETEGLTNIFLGHIKEHIGQKGDYVPFFAVLSVQPPHGPYVTPINSQRGRPHIHPSEIKLRTNVPEVPSIQSNASIDHAGYYAMIEDLDQNIGRICETLKDLSIDRETYIIFFSDHGNLLWSHGQTGKSSPWEESIRVPFIISKVGGPENMRCGRTDALLNHVDIAPTSLGLCGIPIPNEMSGYDYSRHCIPDYAPEYRGNPDCTDEPDSAYLQQIVRKMNPNTVNKAWRGVLMRDGWKYVCTPSNDWLLFDTANDPYEQANHVYSTNFQMQKSHCHNRLSRWIKETGDEFKLPDIRLP